MIFINIVNSNINVHKIGYLNKIKILIGIKKVLLKSIMKKEIVLKKLKKIMR
jgi:hypothetical protein